MIRTCDTRFRKPMLYPLSYEGGMPARIATNLDRRCTRTRRSVAPHGQAPPATKVRHWCRTAHIRRCRTNERTGTIDPSWLIPSSSSPNCWRRRLPASPARTAAVDPVVRPSDRADAQANGALALAKQLGRKPRDVADDVVAAADVRGKATLEVAGPGFINVTFDESFLNEQLGVARRRRPSRRSFGDRHPNGWSSTTRRRTSPRRCTSGTCARR